jgi:hypothetical protein
VELKEGSRDPQAAGQLRYARVIDAGMKVGLTLLVAGFFAYALDVLPALVALEDLPRTWTLSAAEYLRETGTPGGWGWLRRLDHGDVVPLLGIATLSAVPLAALLALIPFYAARKDWIYLVIVALLSGILALAASGFLSV